MNRIVTIILIGITTLIGSSSFAKKSAYSVKLTAEAGLMTATIQKAINTCAENGGGEVIFSAGTYHCGGIELKSKVALHFEKGAMLPTMLKRQTRWIRVK